MPSESVINKVWQRGTLSLQPGVMRLLAWKPGFDPSNSKPTTTQVWVRLCNLPWVFWKRHILSDKARGIGIPLRFDKNMIMGEFEHYARILIDIDLAKPLKDQIRVDTDLEKFWVSIEYENLPATCSSCQAIGHVTTNCHKNLIRSSKLPFCEWSWAGEIYI